MYCVRRRKGPGLAVHILGSFPKTANTNHLALGWPLVGLQHRPVSTPGTNLLSHKLHSVKSRRDAARRDGGCPAPPKRIASVPTVDRTGQADWRAADRSAAGWRRRRHHRPVSTEKAKPVTPWAKPAAAAPRFLTAIAVSLDLCSEFDDESIASDGVSEPWQVFEWYVVEGLVQSGSDYRGMPGSRKAEAAIRVGGLSAKRYLKSPSVFGLHGVYRVLARALLLDEAGRPAEAGRELLLTWEREHGLQGRKAAELPSPAGMVGWAGMVSNGGTHRTPRPTIVA